jgi:hypothetical protein
MIVTACQKNYDCDKSLPLETMENILWKDRENYITNVGSIVLVLTT